MLDSTEAVKAVVIDGALHDNGMVSFKAALTAEDAEAIRQYVIKRANEDKALETQRQLIPSRIITLCRGALAPKELWRVHRNCYRIQQ